MKKYDVYDDGFDEYMFDDRTVRKTKKKGGSDKAAQFFKYVFVMVLLVGAVYQIYRISLINGRDDTIADLKSSIEDTEREYNNYSERYSFLYRNLIDQAKDAAENDLGMVKAEEADIRTVYIASTSAVVADAGK